MNENMQQYLDKAQVLIEALPYIQRFNRKIIVVKYGGSAMVDEELKKQVIEDVTLLKLVGFKPIIVHGGGKEISRWVNKVGMKPKFVNGLRVTDADTMEVAEMVLGKVNKSLVQHVEELGVRAIGISGKDGGLLKVDKKYSEGQDIGYVGDVKSVNAEILYDLLEKDFLPIVCPVGLDDEYETYNINADDAACAIARAVHAEKLAFLTDIEGVYKDPERSENLDFRALCGGSGAVDVRRQYWGRYAAEAAELYRCDRKRRVQSAYSGRKNPTLPAIGNLYK